MIVEAVKIKILLAILAAVTVISGFVAALQQDHRKFAKPATKQEERIVHGNDRLGSSIYDYNPAKPRPKP